MAQGQVSSKDRFEREKDLVEKEINLLIPSAIMIPTFSPGAKCS